MDYKQKISRKFLEINLQNSKISEVEKILNQSSLSFAIELLSIEKNISLLTKKADFGFLNNVFQTMNTLNRNIANFSPVKTSNLFFYESNNSFYYIKKFPENEFIEFISKVMDKAIYKGKTHTIQDIETVFSIAKDFNISNSKLVNWIGKIVTNTNDKSIFKKLSKLNIFENKELKERYVSILINKIEKLDILDTVFDLYEDTIYTINANNKNNKTHWNILLPIFDCENKGLSYHRIPYVEDRKLKWMEDKKIGYENHPIYYKLYDLHLSHYRDLFFESISQEFYQNLLNKSLREYINIYLPQKKEFFDNLSANDDYSKIKKFNEWILQCPQRSCFQAFDQNEKFLEDCKKFIVFLSLTEKSNIYKNTLKNNNDTMRKNKI